MIERLVSFTTPQEITENLGLPYIFGIEGRLSLCLAQMPHQANYRLSYVQDLIGNPTSSLIYQELARLTMECMKF